VAKDKSEHEDNTDELQDDWNPEEPTVLPIDGILDLHTFSPSELRDLLEDYLAACLEAGILDVRIIHGKGKGILRDRVRSLLAKNTLVYGWSEAPLEAGGWGATLVRLVPKRTGDDPHSR
jgi:DNA-nicking Smr family endonuclease